jgi:signal transduction protein with GAF and PtsI domain
MTIKLTLSVEKSVVLKAKKYAREQGRSLSEIVTNYLRRLSGERDSSEELDREVVGISDEISPDRIPDLQDERFQYLRKKMLHG